MKRVLELYGRTAIYVKYVGLHVNTTAHVASFRCTELRLLPTSVRLRCMCAGCSDSVGSLYCRFVAVFMGGSKGPGGLAPSSQTSATLPLPRQ